MIERVFAGLGDPAAFFRWLRTQPRRLGAAYLVLVVQAVISGGLLAVATLDGSMPQVDRLELFIDQAGAPTEVIAVWAMMLSPLSAFFVWVLVWIPIRIGSGPGERVLEVAAWSQLPFVLTGGVELGGTGLQVPFGDVVAVILSVVGVVWSAWFVYTGVRDLAGGRAAPATAVYAIFWLLPVIGSLLCAPGGGSGGAVL